MGFYYIVIIGSVADSISKYDLASNLLNPITTSIYGKSTVKVKRVEVFEAVTVQLNDIENYIVVFV
jgi:hypothetical protein